MDIALAKSVLRSQARAARAARGDSGALNGNLRAALAPYGDRVLAGYWPMGDEADPRPAMALHQGPVCLPVVTGRAVPLVFRLWKGEPLVPGVFGTSHPPDSAAEVVPDLLIVPMLGFDRSLNRLGYGGGYYDRTLHMLRAARPVAAIGLAWAVQELPEIPTDQYDQPLDRIVTDRDILATGG